jgi:nucleotide-binding universal stress UspA family protein
VTLDGSKLSESALHYLPAIARLGDEFLLLRVEKVPAPTSLRRERNLFPIVLSNAIAKLEPDPPVFAEDEGHAIERVRSEAKDYLEEQALFLRNEGFSVKCDVVFADAPEAGIIQYAKANGPLFIAMATHGRGGIDHAAHGSVAEQVIRSGVAPVLAIRPQR